MNLSYEPPFPFARRMSTLDHLTEGRIGWNIVTGYLDSAAKGMGENGQRAHDDRYAVAEDYMEVVYKLWEGSWADDAVVADAKTGVFTRPDRVRKVRHEGPHFKLDALHLSASRRRSARPCSIRRAPRRRGAPSPPVTPNACSCPARRRT